MRLLFKPPLPGDEKDFRVCIRVIRRPDPPDFFESMQLNDTGRTKKQRAIRVLSREFKSVLD